jgi:ankyrin repeat protein
MLLSKLLFLNLNFLFYFYFRLLIRAGANINSIDNDGWTPLHAAAHWDKHDVIKYLMEKNADLDAKNYAVRTIFYLLEL